MAPVEIMFATRSGNDSPRVTCAYGRPIWRARAQCDMEAASLWAHAGQARARTRGRAMSARALAGRLTTLLFHQ